jgi:N6-adenosine-specific RNA methylase IME4
MPKINLPAEYSAAHRALAAAIKIEQAAHVKNVAEGMEILAIKAKDGVLAGSAAEIKVLAARRIGALIKAEGDAGKLAKGGAEKGVGRRGMRVSEKPALLTLADRGVDKNLAHRARLLEAMSASRFEREVIKVKRLAVASAEGNREVIKEARAERHAVKKDRRQRRMKELVEKVAALPAKKYVVVLADPEWQWEAWSEKGIDSTSADNHYPTSPIEDIKARDVPSICSDDCVLWLWATVPMLPHALEVMDAWGFKYVSHFVWVKDKAGTGYWSRNQHELLLIGTKGKVPAPLEGTQWPSVIEAKRGKHSEKPDTVYDLIESYYPDAPKIELNARKARKGWDRWGNEAPVAEAAE